MKKHAGLILGAIVSLIIAFACLYSPHKTYTLKGEIYIVDYAEDITVILDENGHYWGMKGTEVRPRGTAVIMTIDSMNTETIIDDGIINIEY